MTNEEAIEKILLENCSECGSAILGACSKEDCEIYIAIKALKYRIPKKAIDARLPENCYLKRGRCPCGHVTSECFAFCPECGQALDWRDKE